MRSTSWPSACGTPSSRRGGTSSPGGCATRARTRRRAAPCTCAVRRGGGLERCLRAVFGGRGDDGLLQRFQVAVWPDGGGRWRNVDRWPNAEARTRVNEVFQRLITLEPTALGAEELTPEELPFLRFDAAAQACFDAWRGKLEQTRRAAAVHPVRRARGAEQRCVMPSA